MHYIADSKQLESNRTTAGVTDKHFMFCLKMIVKYNSANI
jgi:hypothetical protein